jgi:hypothetical protein
VVKYQEEVMEKKSIVGYPPNPFLKGGPEEVSPFKKDGEVSEESLLRLRASVILDGAHSVSNAKIGHQKKAKRKKRKNPLVFCKKTVHKRKARETKVNEPNYDDAKKVELV